MIQRFRGESHSEIPSDFTSFIMKDNQILKYLASIPIQFMNQNQSGEDADICGSSINRESEHPKKIQKENLLNSFDLWWSTTKGLIILYVEQNSIQFSAQCSSYQNMQPRTDWRRIYRFPQINYAESHGQAEFSAKLTLDDDCPHPDWSQIIPWKLWCLKIKSSCSS